MRDKEARDREPRLSPKDTVIVQLDQEIHQLSTVLKIMDLKEHMLALLDELKTVHARLRELSLGLKRS